MAHSQASLDVRSCTEKASATSAGTRCRGVPGPRRPESAAVAGGGHCSGNLYIAARKGMGDFKIHYCRALDAFAGAQEAFIGAREDLSTQPDNHMRCHVLPNTC